LIFSAEGTEGNCRLQECPSLKTYSRHVFYLPEQKNVNSTAYDEIRQKVIRTAVAPKESIVFPSPVAIMKSEITSEEVSSLGNLVFTERREKTTTWRVVT